MIRPATIRADLFLRQAVKTDPFMVYTDGACKGNPGPGGWGSVIVQNNLLTTLSGPAEQTTNNRMELIAAIESLGYLPAGAIVHLATDSQYLKNGIESWIKGWKMCGWKTKSGTPVKNVDLWEKLDLLRQSRIVKWYWVKGHDDNEYNNMADKLAVAAIPKSQKSRIANSKGIILPEIPYSKAQQLPLETFKQKLNTEALVKVWTDGACSGNPGPGGWGVVFQQGSFACELNGGEPVTTNNRMELTAAIVALEVMPAGCPILLTTDSSYVQKGITNWIANWKRNGWKTSDNKEVKNQDLWRRLDAAKTEHELTWAWVKGHYGDEHNERADRLAVAGRKEHETRL